MTINTTSHPPPVGLAMEATAKRPRRRGWSPRVSPDQFAMVFYSTAATGAVIGQVWVAMTHIPWPDGLAFGWRLAAVAPFAITLELLAMVLAAMADQRQRMGEQAIGFRVFSAAVAALAVAVIVAGHWGDPYTVAAFGGLSVSAYALWLLHSAARRRDALRAAGKLDETAPAYGLYRRLRHPVMTARAAELARQGTTDPDAGRWRPLGLHESLRAAEEDRRAQARRPAIAAAIDRVVRADHADPLMAEIASATLDLDRIAAELTAHADYAGWAARLAPAVSATPPGPAPGADIAGGHVRMSGADITPQRPVSGTAKLTARPADLPAAGPRRKSSRTRGGQPGTVAERIAALVEQHPDMTRTELARQVGTSTRHVRRVLADMTTRTPEPAPDPSGHAAADTAAPTDADVSGKAPAVRADIDAGRVPDIEADMPAGLNGHRPA